MKFKSQICTTREQSQRLLSLGLKKETADMGWGTITLNGESITFSSEDSWDDNEITEIHIPAWSLHRLWELSYIKSIILDSQDEIAVLYDEVITEIEQQIKDGYFNKEYLEE